MKKRTKKLIHKVIHYIASLFTCLMFWIGMFAFLFIGNPSLVPAIVFVVAIGWCCFYILWCEAKERKAVRR